MLAATLILTSSVSATGTSSEVSRVVYFSIQSNTACAVTGDHVYFSDLYLTINNLSDYENQLTVELFKKDGTPYTTPGLSGTGLASDFIPGTATSINPHSTIQYWMQFDQDKDNCSERPSYGKIIVHTNAGLIMGSGEMQGIKRITNTNGTSKQNSEMYQTATIIINGGNPF